MTHILFVIAHLQRTGPVNILYSLCKGLKSAHFGVTIVTLRPENTTSRAEDFETLDIPIHCLGASLLECELMAGGISSRIRHLARTLKPDIIHAHGYHAVLGTAPLTKVMPCLTTLHNRADEDFLNAKGPLLGRYMLYRYMRALRHFRSIIAVSPSTASPYKQWGLGNVEIVNNGIDTRKFKPISEEPSGLPVFIVSGRVEPEKGIPDILQAFAQLPYKLVVLGTGSMLETYRAKARNNPNIQLVGHTDQVEDCLRAGNYYISNSQSEGLSLAVCEAISCGLWPILSDIPSHRDILDTCRIGTLIPTIPTTPGSILQAVKTAIGITVDREALHRTIETYFSAERMVQDYIKIYEKI